MKTGKGGRRPTVGYLLYSLGRAFVAPSSSSPRCGLAPSGNDQGQARWTAAATRPRSWVRPRRANRAPRRWRQRVPVPLPSTPPFRLPASHPAARGDGPSALKQKTGPFGAYGFHRYAAEPPFFSLPRAIHRLLLGACDGGSEGDGQARAGHRFLQPMLNPVLVGPGRSSCTALPRGCLMLRLTKEDRNCVKKTTR